MNAWDHLPNAKLIDQVLSDLESNHEVFARAWHAAGNADWNDMVFRAAHQRLSYVDLGAPKSDLNAAWDTTKVVIKDKAWGATMYAARCTAWDAILVFIVYDDSPKYLNMPYEKLKIWAELSENPAAVLLLSYVWAREQISPKIYA